MTDDELKAIEARAMRKYESDAEEDVIALVAEVRRLRAMLPERLRCSLCGCGLEPCDLPGGVCSGCDPEGSANAEARRCHVGESDTDDEEQFECTLHQGHSGPCNLKRVED